MKKIAVGNLGIIVTGKTPRTNIPENYGGNIPFLTPTDDLTPIKCTKTLNTLSERGVNEVKSCLLPRNAICVSCIGSDMGHVIMTSIPTVTNQQFNSIIPSEDYYPEYVYYLMVLLGKIMKSKFGKSSTAVPIVSKSLFSSFELFVNDSKKEQKILADVLRCIDDKISLNTRMNAELEAMAKQLYDYWFVQFDFPDENGKPYKSSGGKMVYNSTLKREIPEGWEDTVLSDIANITMGQSPDGSSYNEVGDGTVFYQGSTDFGIRFPSVRMYTTEPTRFAKKGDILMSVRAPVGDTNIANEDCCIGRGLSAINSKIGSTSHLYFIIGDLKAKFNMLNSAGTTFGAITKDELYNMPIIKPDKEIMLKYEAICSPIFDKQMIIGYEVNHLTHLRDSLLPMLMNGQVTVE